MKIIFHRLIAFLFLAAPLLELQAFAAPSVQTVLIENVKFNPDHLEIQAGDTVIWKNKDLVSHTVTEEKNLFNSGDIKPGGSWKRKFKTSGEISYKCLYHPQMKASLTIQKR